MVPMTGLEPVRYRYRGILSPLCLPIPPHRRKSYHITYLAVCQVKILKLAKIYFACKQQKILKNIVDSVIIN